MVNKVLIIAAGLIAVVAVTALHYTLSYSAGQPNQFLIEVTPSRVVDGVVGQKCVIIVKSIDNENVLEGREGYSEPATISVAVNDEAASLTYHPKELLSGQISEVVVVPNEASANSLLTVLIQGERGGVKELKFITINVHGLTNDIKEAESHAVGVRDQFTSWVAVSDPKLNITEETAWSGSHVVSVSPNTKYYLFYSSKWEMGVSWCVDGSHNRTVVYLRQRYEENAPSLAYELSLLSNGYYSVHPISTKTVYAETVWR